MPLPHDWDAGHEAVWAEYTPGTTRAIGLRHPTYPYEDTLASDDSQTLIGFAGEYLRKVADLFGLPAALGVTDILETDPTQFVAAARLVWLTVHATQGTPAPPHASFVVRRYVDPVQHATTIDRTVVVLAVQSAASNEPTQVLGSRLGIRIVAHIAPATGSTVRVRITSASCSSELAPTLAVAAPRAQDFFAAFFSNVTPRAEIMARLIGVASRALGYGDKDSIFIDGFRLVAGDSLQATIEAYLVALAPDDRPDTPSYAVRAAIEISTGPSVTLRALETSPLVAHAGPVRTLVFTQDPASQAGIGGLTAARPNRAPSRLLNYVQTRTLAGLQLGFLDATLLDDLNQVDVLQSRLVAGNADETKTQLVYPICIIHPRMDWFAATSAYQHARGLVPTTGLARRGLFDTIRSYGLSPLEFFRFATFPLRVRYRARITPGPGKDGKIVNAQVNFDGFKGNLIGTSTTPSFLPIQVKFGLADVKRSSSRREPLGLATDPRWSWHEYGHVLLAASTGALQFRFAHSAGDALAAILSDPESKLARNPRMRGLTFPWVYLNRRHDRDVFQGWSWSGRYHRAHRFSTDVNSYAKKGYGSEQILSSSLFRLYRALGGDNLDYTSTPPVPHETDRRQAADYTVYLLLKTIKLMNPATLAPMQTPDQLVSALIDADIGTLPASSGPLAGRVGGCAHKVVRWAFEAQGLYATGGPLAVVDKPGEPPDPDIFIDDRRPDSPGDHPRGGYMPVPLDWQPAVEAPRVVPSPLPTPPNPANPPLWHARDEAIEATGHQVKVQVRNRGVTQVNQVTVQIWWIVWPTAAPAPPWSKGTWNSLTVSASKPVPTTPGASAPVDFGPFTLPTQPSGTRLLIVAETTCVPDPANTDGATSLPCSTLPTPLVDLVSGDNNLGLRVHLIP